MPIIEKSKATPLSRLPEKAKHVVDVDCSSDSEEGGYDSESESDVSEMGRKRNRSHRRSKSEKRQHSRRHREKYEKICRKNRRRYEYSSDSEVSVELTDSDSLVCSVGSKRDHKYGRWDEGKQHKRGRKRSRGRGRCKTNVIADAIDACGNA